MNSHTRMRAANVDDLDGLLTAFFQAEVPNPWPELRLPAARPARRNRWLPRVRSRFALAAAVAVLVAGAVLLGGSFRSVPQSAADPLGIPSAKNEKMELILEQSPDGPTTIKIIFDDLPAPR